MQVNIIDPAELLLYVIRGVVATYTDVLIWLLTAKCIVLSLDGLA